MTTLLADTSVLIKWFHSEGESGLAEARRLRDATQVGEVQARVIDLALYEMGNVLLGALGWAGSDVAGQLENLVTICGPPLAMTGERLRHAADLGLQPHLTFHEAAWAASARALGIPLVTADALLLRSGLGGSPGALVQRLRLGR